MSRKYRITAILLVICLCMALVPEKAYAQEAEGISLEDTKEQGEENALEDDMEAEEPMQSEQQEEEQTDAGDSDISKVKDAESSDVLREENSEPKDEQSEPSGTEKAAAGEDIATEEDITAEDDDPGKGRLGGDAPDEFYDTGSGMRAMATGIRHNSKFAGYKIIEGIDVSKYNKTIDWAAVKKAGIDFAFVRTSYRGYGKAGNLAADPYAEVNMKNAAAAGVRVGAYIFSQAITVKEAQEEADYLLNSVKGYNITMPLVFDFEYFSGGRLDNANLSKRVQTDICLAFCKKIEAAGYTPLVYANKSMLTSGLYASEISSKYPVWLAHYTSASDYAGDYSFWQYTEKGSVSGITGDVDMNFWYVKPGESMSFNVPGAPAVTTPTVTAPSATTLSGEASSYDKVKLTWKKVPEAAGYVIYRYNSPSKSYEKIKTISGADTTSYTDTGRTMRTTYKYRIKTYKNADGSTVYSKSSGTVSVKTASTMTGKTNVSGVAVRKGPSVSKGRLKTLSINTGVTITGTSGSWYRISIKIGGKKKTGYIKKSYITIIRMPTLSVSSVSSSKIKLTWDQISGASGYEIQRYDPSKKKYIKIKTIKKGSTVSYTNSGLNTNTTYKYKIRSYKTVKGKKIYSYYCTARSAKTK